MHRAKRIPLIIALIFSASMPIPLWGQEMAPLGDITQDNVIHQMKRCSAFSAATRSLLAEERLSVTDPETRARFDRFIDQAEKNADGLTQSAVIAMTVLEGKSDEEAIDDALAARDGMTPTYLRSLSERGLGFAGLMEDPLWANDAVACRALIEGLAPIMRSITQ